MAAAAAENSSRSSASADSYIGSLISLTSKSEIRYEGILYNINTEESSIGLRSVRSFGTEGRKKDGPQVMPSDKVYEYILFRGSDIKDLQVKSSPPVQTAPPISDPAIIQSHYPRPASTSSTLPASSGSLTDLSPHTPQLGQPASNFQGGLPLYQSGGTLGSWGPSPPPPNANGSGLMPMYWPGFYGPPNGLPQMHPQSLLRPPHGLSMPPPMQQAMQYPNFNASVPSGISNLPDYPSGLLPGTSSSTNQVSAPSASLNVPSSLPPVAPVLLSGDPNMIQNKALNFGLPTVQFSGSLTSVSSLTNSSADVNALVPPISNKSSMPSSLPLPYQGISHPISSIGSSSIQTESQTPSLVTPGQLLHPGPAIVVASSQSSQASGQLLHPGPAIAVVSSQSSQAIHKDVEVVKVSPLSSESSAPVPNRKDTQPPLSVRKDTQPQVPIRRDTQPQLPIRKDAQPPLLPLPTQSRIAPKVNGAAYQYRNSYRGRERGRGTGTSRPAMRFTEEFDFTAMNEKFNKDEVWGHLGKSNKSSSKEKDDGHESDEDYEDEDTDADVPKIEVKPVYSKDDFFDTLSCDALDRSNSGRPRFSEQMKLDTETFGEFPRHRGGWGGGGRGPYRGGRYRGGSYYGRGYGYVGRGRGGRSSFRDY